MSSFSGASFFGCQFGCQFSGMNHNLSSIGKNANRVPEVPVFNATFYHLKKRRDIGGVYRHKDCLAFFAKTGTRPSIYRWLNG